ncbi:MAG: Ni/Fe-hydrogenase, b-type cytochrome subunit [Clostridia bacterium]|nr:Ni/Fe-hydrogenase, b-type cytochrome subunit [Clostridia bacterium]
MAKPLDHPLPQRLYHWVNLISMAVLIITGFYINKPYTDGLMNGMRYLHFLAMFIIIANLTVRIYYAFVGKYKDAGDFAMRSKDWQNLLPTVKYYLFLGPHPDNGKYNPMQKLMYLFYLPLLLLQGFTGLIMYRPELFDSLIKAMGGLASVRGYHYVLMWVFIAYIIVHVYMVLTEAWDEVKLMLFGIAEKEK